MNELKIAEFLAMAEEFLRANRVQLDRVELDQFDQLYDNLAEELDRRDLFDDLYH